jgi:hypothetical protein
MVCPVKKWLVVKLVTQLGNADGHKRLELLAIPDFTRLREAPSRKPCWRNDIAAPA